LDALKHQKSANSNNLIYIADEKISQSWVIFGVFIYELYLIKAKKFKDSFDSVIGLVADLFIEMVST
jgi:hypothetical protein